MTTDLTNFAMVPDRCSQGMLNALLMMRFMTQSAFAKDPAVTYGGVGVISTNSSDWHYYGNSQGGILGSVYMAVTTDVTLGVSGVGGGPYALLLPRSSDFAAIFDIMRLRYSSPVDRISLFSFLQLLWDRMEPSVRVCCCVAQHKLLSLSPPSSSPIPTPTHGAVVHARHLH